MKKAFTILSTLMLTQTNFVLAEGEEAATDATPEATPEAAATDATPEAEAVPAAPREPTILDGSNWNELVIDKETNNVKGDKGWFIKFYAPWCGHCKKLAPVWTEFAESSPDVNVAKIDCTSDEGKPICKDFGVKGYPTLIWFPANQEVGKLCRYKSSRVLKSFQAYAAEGKWEGSECEPLPGNEPQQ